MANLHETELEALRRANAQQANQIAHLLAIIADVTARLPPCEEPYLPNSIKSQIRPQPTYTTPSQTTSTSSKRLSYPPCHYPNPSTSNIQSYDRAHNGGIHKDIKRSTQNANPPKRQPRRFTPLDIPRDDMFQKLVKEGILKPLQPPPLPTKLSPSHRIDQYCKYHQGTGHTTLACQGLAHKIQDLIDCKVIPPPPYLPKTIPSLRLSHQDDQVNRLINSMESSILAKLNLGRSIQTVMEPKPVVPAAPDALKAKDRGNSVNPTMETV